MARRGGVPSFRPAVAFPLAAMITACGLPGGGGGEATVYRDVWGVPHIYAESAEAGLYASGWTMAEDRLSQLLENYLFGLGEYAAAFGPGNGDAWLRSDLEARMWDHYGTAKRHYEAKLNPELRSHLTAFIAGMNDYLEQHPDEAPAWWGDRLVDVYMPIAFSRQFIWSWPAGQARSDLRAIGIEPSFDVDLRASNEIALAPDQTTFGAAALVIDPHLSWLGRHRYWELRLHAGDIHISGFATSGFPYVNLGHNEHVAWAHTTGGPDTADIYELTLDPDDPGRYLYDGAWRQMESRRVEVAVAGEASPREFTFWYSHHGPIVARRGDRAYAAALAYREEIGYLESKYWFNVAEDYLGAARALDVRQIMPQKRDDRGYRRERLLPEDRAGAHPARWLRLESAGRRIDLGDGVAWHPPGVRPDVPAQPGARLHAEQQHRSRHDARRLASGPRALPPPISTTSPPSTRISAARQRSRCSRRSGKPGTGGARRRSSSWPSTVRSTSSTGGSRNCGVPKRRCPARARRSTRRS